MIEQKFTSIFIYFTSLAMSQLDIINYHAEIET